MAELKAFGFDLNIPFFRLKKWPARSKKIKNVLDKNEAVNYFAY